MGTEERPPLTPAKRLRGLPAGEVLVHELGHTIVGAEIGVVGGSIEFPDDQSVHQARAHYTKVGSSPEMIATRALAGPVMQARRMPNTITQSLREKLTAGTMFTSSDCLCAGGVIEREMIEHGFGGDWAAMLEQANTLQSGARVHFLKLAHERCLLLVDTKQFDEFFDACLQDLRQWFDEADDDLHFSPSMFYGGDRIAKVRARLRKLTC